MATTIAQAHAIQPRRRLYYGWWVVVASALALFFGPIPIAVFAFGVFLQPWSQEFHAGRGALSLARTIHSTVLPLGLPFVGWLSDRYGVRKITVPAAILSSVVLLSAYTVGSLRQLYILYLLLGLATCGVGPLQYCDVVSRWFDGRRGLALGLTMLGLGTGALVTPLAAQYLIARAGWRLTLTIFGAAALVVTVPCIAIFIKDSPEGELGRRSEAEGMDFRDAMRTGTFWALFCCFILVASGVQAVLSHIASILVDRGSGAATAALATSLFGGGVLAGRSGSGYLLDRFFAPRVAAVTFGLAALGTWLLRMAGSQEIAYAAALCIGLGMGGEVDIMAYLTSRYFGLRAFGTIYGMMFAGYALAGGLGTYLMGATFDATSSYVFALDLTCLATAVGGAIMLWLGPYRYQSRLNSSIGR